MSVDVHVDSLSVVLSGNRILDEVNLRIPAGSFLALLGPSGSGKTTTLNVLTGFTQATSGRVLLGGSPLDGVPVHRRDIGVVFQNYALFPHLTVGQNIEFPLLARKVPKAARREQVAAVLELVHLAGIGDRSVRSLSGGQQQRVALARALVFSPALLLLDEPLAALDKQLREAMQIEIRRIQRETATTTVAVTHDQAEALSMADLVAVMNHGRIEQVGTPEEVYHRPVSLFVARFLGEANLLRAAGGRVEGFGVPVEGEPDGTVVLRPEDLVLTSPDAPGSLTATITQVVYQGPRLRVTAAADGGSTEPIVVTAVPGELATTPAVGDRIGLRHRGPAPRTLPTTDSRDSRGSHGPEPSAARSGSEAVAPEALPAPAQGLPS